MMDRQGWYRDFGFRGGPGRGVCAALHARKPGRASPRRTGPLLASPLSMFCYGSRKGRLRKEVEGTDPSGPHLASGGDVQELRRGTTASGNLEFLECQKNGGGCDPGDRQIFSHFGTRSLRRRWHGPTWNTIIAIDAGF